MFRRGIRRFELWFVEFKIFPLSDAELLGAVGFTYTAISPFNPGLFILETICAIVALYGLWKIWTKRGIADVHITTGNAEA